jgi:type II secretory pathway pseudopilin PulG
MLEENPALPPDPALLNRQPKWFKPVFYGMIVASILFILALLTAPITVRSRKKADQVEATSNVRQIGLALLEFDIEYGTFPSDATVALVAKLHPAHSFDLSGKSSNAMFRQLFAAELTQSEQMFYAKVRNARKPDGNFAHGKALERGEVGFAFISGLSSKDDPNTPIVLAPMIPGTTKFDTKGFEGYGQAVFLFTDNSARSFKIEKDGHIYDKGIDLLSPKHPIWKGKKPDIRYPEF